MAAPKYSATARCVCGNPLKVFASSGRIADACGIACGALVHRRKNGVQPKRVSKPSVCMDCGGPVDRGSYRCRPCYAHHHAIRPRSCKGCGKAFTPKRESRITYCSRECAGKHNNPVKSERPSPFSSVYFMACACCGGPFIARRETALTCSTRCANRKRNAEIKGTKARTCKRCGVEFAPGYPDKRREYCSRNCSRRAGASKSRKKYGNSYRDRARKAGVRYERVNREAVFDRDGWRCQICGKSTPKARQGHRYSNSPELDHRVPFAQKGPHTYDNVQCACRACNQWKLDHAVLGQIPLFNQ